MEGKNDTPYGRAIEHLGRLYGAPESVYSGAFEAVLAIFPALKPTEIALDVVRRRVRESRATCN